MSQRSDSESSNGGLEEQRVPDSTESQQLSLDEGLPVLMEETEEETVEGALLEQQALLEIIQAGPPMPQQHDDGSLDDEGIAAEGQPIVIEPFEELVANGILPPPPPIMFADMPMSPAAAVEFIEEDEEGLLGHVIIYDPLGVPHYAVQQPAQYDAAGFDEDQDEQHEEAGFEDQEDDAGFEEEEQEDDEDM